MSFTEARLEQAIIDLLAEQGYPHVLGSTLEFIYKFLRLAGD